MSYAELLSGKRHVKPSSIRKVEEDLSRAIDAVGDLLRSPKPQDDLWHAELIATLQLASQLLKQFKAGSRVAIAKRPDDQELISAVEVIACLHERSLEKYVTLALSVPQGPNDPRIATVTARSGQVRLPQAFPTPGRMQEMLRGRPLTPKEVAFINRQLQGCASSYENDPDVELNFLCNAHWVLAKRYPE